MAQKISISSDFIIYDGIGHLQNDDQSLINAAHEAARRAYAPYSDFKVGASVVMENGEIITGNNQENAAYPSGLCAERVAVFYASSQFPGLKIKAVAISASGGLSAKPVSPCGSCRQVMAEYETKQNEPIKIWMAIEHGPVYSCESVKALLPLMFGKSDLEK